MEISVGNCRGLLLETYRYSMGQVAPASFHAHPEYQLSFSPNEVGEYLCRNGKLEFAPLTLAVLHSGERHAPSKVLFEKPATYCVMYVTPEEILKAAKEIGWRKNELPYFKNPFITDRNLTVKFLRFFNASTDETLLSSDVFKLDFLTYLMKNFAQNISFDDKHRRNPACVKLAREFLDENFNRAVSLVELARIAGVGKYYLCREFKRVVDFTPHQYQNHLRINFARRLLLQNTPLTEIAYELGYYDQSHFGKYFKRHVGIAPNQYHAGATFS